MPTNLLGADELVSKCRRIIRWCDCVIVFCDLWTQWRRQVHKIENMFSWSIIRFQSSFAHIYDMTHLFTLARHQSFILYKTIMKFCLTNIILTMLQPGNQSVDNAVYVASTIDFCKRTFLSQTNSPPPSHVKPTHEPTRRTTSRGGP